MRIDQLVYASAETVRGKGYQTLARSRGISEEELREIEKYSEFPVAIPQECLETYRESVSYYVLNSGRICIAKTFYVGRDVARRHGGYLTHSLIVSKPDFDTMDRDPFVLIHAGLFSISDDMEYDVQPITFAGPGRTESLKKKLGRLVKQMNHSQLSSVLQGLLSGSRVVVVAGSAPDWHVAEAVLCCFPHAKRGDFTFSTFRLHPDEIDKFSLNFVPPQVREDFLKPGGDSWLVVDLTLKEKQVRPESSKYVDFVASKVFRGNYQQVERYLLELESLELGRRLDKAAEFAEIFDSLDELESARDPALAEHAAGKTAALGRSEAIAEKALKYHFKAVSWYLAGGDQDSALGALGHAVALAMERDIPECKAKVSEFAGKLLKLFCNKGSYSYAGQLLDLTDEAQLDFSGHLVLVRQEILSSMSEAWAEAKQATAFEEAKAALEILMKDPGDAASVRQVSKVIFDRWPRKGARLFPAVKKFLDEHSDRYGFNLSNYKELIEASFLVGEYSVFRELVAEALKLGGGRMGIESQLVSIMRKLSEKRPGVAIGQLEKLLRKHSRRKRIAVSILLVLLGALGALVPVFWLRYWPVKSSDHIPDKEIRLTPNKKSDAKEAQGHLGEKQWKKQQEDKKEDDAKSSTDEKPPDLKVQTGKDNKVTGNKGK